MSNIIHRKPYRNWVRGALGLLYVREGLYPFTDRVVKAEHARILQNLAPCNSCTINKIQPVHANRHVCIHKSKSKCNCRQKTNKTCNTCSELYDELILQHRFRDPFLDVDASIWCSDHWQIAKCFMTSTTPGSNNTAADTDAAGLLSIITNALFFQSEIQCNINPPHDTFSQVREIRNTILHNSTLELSDTEVTRYLHAMIAVLEDQTELINDPSAQAAVEKLKEMVYDELVVTTKEEARAIQTAVDAIKKAKEQCEDSIRALAEEKLKEFTERKENSEDRMRQLTVEGENIVKKATEQSEKCIDNLTEEKQTLVQLQALEAVQKINTAVAEYEPEYVTNLKIKHVDHEKRINAVEKKQSDLEVKQKHLEKKVDLLRSAQDKHQTRMDYLKQKQALQRHLVELYQKHYVKTWLSPLRTQDNDFNISAVYVSPNMVVEEKDYRDRNKPEEFDRNETDLTRMKKNEVPEKSALRHINRYQDIFGSRAGKNKRIFIVGDVGTGKKNKIIISNRECHVPKTQPPQNEHHSTQKCTPPTHTHTHTTHTIMYTHTHIHYQHTPAYKANTRGQHEQLKEHSGAPPWNGQWQKHHWGA